MSDANILPSGPPHGYGLATHVDDGYTGGDPNRLNDQDEPPLPVSPDWLHPSMQVLLPTAPGWGFLSAPQDPNTIYSHIFEPEEELYRFPFDGIAYSEANRCA